MPYYVSGLIHTSDQLMALTPEEAIRKRGINLKIMHEVRGIDREAQKVEVHDLKDGRDFEQEYSKLVIATGASAIRPDLPGAHLAGIFTLKSFQDGLDLKGFVEHAKPTRGVIMGGGYIGVEIAEAFGRLGMEVTIIEALPRIMSVMDEDVSQLVAEELTRNYFTVLTGRKVVAFGGKENVQRVILEDGRAVDADCVVISIGVMPNSSLAERSGLELGERRAILVDSFHQTTDKDIYAAGDCCTAYHRVLERNVYIPLGLTANRQGRMCGENLVAGLAGEVLMPFPGILGTAITKVYDLEVGKTGIGAAEIERYARTGIGSVEVKARNLPGYYPGSADLLVKLYYEETSKIVVGGQVAGKGGVAARLDTLVAAIAARMTLADLYSLDMAYAPPFAPVWDPLLVAARAGMK